MQFKVPQNIDMQDRVVGPLTLVQFVYVLVGGMVIYFLFNTVGVADPVLFTAIALPLGFFTFALAFLRVQDQPFPRFFVASVVYLLRPKSRIWRRDEAREELTIVPDAKPSNPLVPPKKITKSQLDQVIQALDTGSRPAPENLSATTRGTSGTNAAQTTRPVLDSVRR